jgi:hypothetical protein
MKCDPLLDWTGLATTEAMNHRQNKHSGYQKNDSKG